MALTKVSFSMINGDAVNPLDYGVTGDGTTDDATGFNDALQAAAGKILYIPKQSGSFYLVGNNLLILSNTTIVCEPGVVIKTSVGTFGTGDAIFYMNEVDNVTIYGNGATLQGLREGTGLATISMGVKIAGSTNVRVYDLKCIDASGDGFLVQGADDNTPIYSENVWLERCVADNNMRQGLSIIGAKNLIVKDCDFNNTTGKAPGAGVDIEPDPTAPLFNVQLINCRASGNEYSQFVCDFNDTIGPVNVLFDGCVAYDATAVNAAGFQISNVFVNKSETGIVQLNNCVATNTDSYGLLLRNIDEQGISVHVNNFQSINTNTGQRTNYGAIDAPISIYAANNPTFFPNPGNVHINGIKIYDEVALRGPYAIVADGAVKWNNVTITGLEWVNTVGELTIPYMDSGTTNTQIEWYPYPFRVTRTADTTLSSRWNGWYFDNIGDTGVQNFTLPPVAPNLEFNFEVHAAFAVRITPNAADRLRPYASADAKYMESSTVGSTATVKSNADGTDWVVQRFGTWTDEP